jgi:hypothetical protein
MFKACVRCEDAAALEGSDFCRGCNEAVHRAEVEFDRAAEVATKAREVERRSSGFENYPAARRVEVQAFQQAGDAARAVVEVRRPLKRTTTGRAFEAHLRAAQAGFLADQARDLQAQDVARARVFELAQRFTSEPLALERVSEVREELAKALEFYRIAGGVLPQ